MGPEKNIVIGLWEVRILPAGYYLPDLNRRWAGFLSQGLLVISAGDSFPNYWQEDTRLGSW